MTERHAHPQRHQHHPGRRDHGLNIKTGQTVAQEAVGTGTKTFQYNSCSIANALNHIGSLQRLRNGWTDTWSSW